MTENMQARCVPRFIQRFPREIFEKTLDIAKMLCYNAITKGVDEDGTCKLFSQRAGGGVSPVKCSRISHRF